MNLRAFAKKGYSLLRDPRKILIKMLLKLAPYIKNDEVYLKILFRLRLGYKLDLINPITYNQKLQWLKINHRDPLMTKLADKYESKEYIANLIGEEFVVKNYGVWNSFDEIDFNLLPSKFVLKTTHDQGGVVICRDKNNFNFENAKTILNNHLSRKNFYSIGREWQYKNIKPRIIAEELLSESEIEIPNDFKFFCFNGIPKVMVIAVDRHIKTRYYYYDMNFNLLDLKMGDRSNIIQNQPKPKKFEKMKEIATVLSSGFPQIRVDFYNINEKIYIGELTFYSGGGTTELYPRKYDYIWGSWIDLNLIKNK